MEVRVSAETAKKLTDLAEISGRAREDVVENALAGHLEEAASVRLALDSRRDVLESGRVTPIRVAGAFRTRREKRERRPR